MYSFEAHERVRVLVDISSLFSGDCTLTGRYDAILKTCNTEMRYLPL
jgi:hypothetical protein